MKTRNASISLSIVIMVLLFFFLKRWQEPKLKEIFNRDPDYLVYSRQALCIMQCLDIDSAEIDYIIERGVIMINRSNRRARPCALITMQGRTSTGKSLRVIFEQCSKETRVINSYNLEKDITCDCPGNEIKRAN